MRIYPLMTLALASALAFPGSSSAQSPRLKLDIGNLAARAKEVVNISLDKSSVEWAGQAVGSKGADGEKLRNLMKELDGITVQALEFEKDKAPAWEELIGAARGAIQELDGSQWQSIVSVTEKKGNGSEMVRVSLLKDSAGQIGGLAILAIEPAELVLVNISGKVRLDQLESLGSALGHPGILGGLGAKKEPKEQGK